MRRAVPTEMRVALTLWFMATGAIVPLVTYSAFPNQLFSVKGCVFCHHRVCCLAT